MRQNKSAIAFIRIIIVYFINIGACGREAGEGGRARAGEAGDGRRDEAAVGGGGKLPG